LALRHFAQAKPQVALDINWLTGSAGSIENDPQPTTKAAPHRQRPCASRRRASQQVRGAAAVRLQLVAKGHTKSNSVTYTELSSVWAQRRRRGVRDLGVDLLAQAGHTDCAHDCAVY